MDGMDFKYIYNPYIDIITSETLFSKSITSSNKWD